jgi:hypothetical protein
MWNRGFGVLWVKVHINKGRQFHLHIPVSLLVFRELFDCLIDIMEFACLFLPKYPSAHHPHAISAHSVKEMIRSLDQLFRSLIGHEPYDLVEINTKNVTVSIRIR